MKELIVVLLVILIAQIFYLYRKISKIETVLSLLDGDILSQSRLIYEIPNNLQKCIDLLKKEIIIKNVLKIP